MCKMTAISLGSAFLLLATITQFSGRAPAADWPQEPKTQGRVLPPLSGTIPLGDAIDRTTAKGGGPTINGETQMRQETGRPYLPRVPEAWDRWPGCRQTADC